MSRTGSMVEHVARALMIARGSDVVTKDEHWPQFVADGLKSSDRELYADLHEAMRDARAAIEALREPTEAMTEHETYQHGMWSRRNIEAWIRAALAPAGAGEG